MCGLLGLFEWCGSDAVRKKERLTGSLKWCGVRCEHEQKAWFVVKSFAPIFLKAVRPAFHIDFEHLRASWTH